MSSDPPFRERRHDLASRIADRGRIDHESTVDAIRAVPRHAFVPDDVRDRAYRDQPLPIGDGQTISAPHIVAVMTDLLDVDAGDRVLEIGTGCGYHAAVTADVVGAENVFSVEYSESLAERTRERLAELGYGDVSIRVGDGRDGWPDHAPYDAAYLTCACEDVPAPILDQVNEGGHVVAPVGRASQRLVRLTVDDDVERESHGRVRFVRMRG